MASQVERAERFLELHEAGSPLLMPNAWDVGSARLLASLGFQALATTSSGHAATLGRLDGSVARDEVLEHCAALVAAADLPVSADLESGFGETPDEVAETVRLAAATGLAGCSVEDATALPDEPIRPVEAAAERVIAAAEAAHGGPVRLVLTARAENHVHGRSDLPDTIDRLQRYQAAGADVLFAPAVVAPEDLRRLVAEVDVPVSVLTFPGCPTVAEMAAIGVSRVSVGGAFAFAALGAMVAAAEELRDQGTLGFLTGARAGGRAARAAFGP